MRLNKLSHPVWKMVLLAVCMGLLGLAVWRDTPCPIRHFTHIPCPACGMSRSYLALLHGDVAGAFHHHPMFWCVPLAVLTVLWEGALFQNQRWNNLFNFGLVAGLLLCWFIRLIGSAAGWLGEL